MKTQFYLKDEIILINLSGVQTISRVDRSVIISFMDKNRKNITEVLENKEEAEKYFMYIANAIHNGDSIISKLVFKKILEKNG